MAINTTLTKASQSRTKISNEVDASSFRPLEESRKQSSVVIFMRIKEFQKMMKQLFFDRDTKRGLKGTYYWLVDEIEELGEAMEGGNLEAIQNECADVLAWLASLSNIIGVDLEEAALRKYVGKCPKCEENPCECSFS